MVSNYKQSIAGFTLIELLMTLTLVSLLLGIAVPNLSSFIAKLQFRNQSSALYESLYLARNYAMTNQQLVQVCSISKQSPEQCSGNYQSGASWSDGWMIYSDLNQNNQFDQSDQIIKTYTAIDHAKIMFNQRGRLRFFPNGGARSAGFYLCSDAVEEVRHIYLLHTGRVRIKDKLGKSQKQRCKNMQ